MTRTDTFVVGTLVVLLALVAGLIGVPALAPRRLDVAAPPSRERRPRRATPLRRGRPRPSGLGQRR